MLYDDAGGRVEPPMGVVPFDGQDVFPQRGLAGALLCDGGVPIRGHGRFLLSTEKKECCFNTVVDTVNGVAVAPEGVAITPQKGAVSCR